MYSFLGLINFLNRYSPQLAELCAPLRSLILKDAHYTITEEHRSEFAALKNEFRKTIVLLLPTEKALWVKVLIKGLIV